MGEKDEAKPDARLYNLMMHTYGKAGKLSEQQALFRQMKGSGVPMTAVTFNSLMAFQRTVADAEACLRYVWLARFIIPRNCFSTCWLSILGCEYQIGYSISGLAEVPSFYAISNSY